LAAGDLGYRVNHRQSMIASSWLPTLPTSVAAGGAAVQAGQHAHTRAPRLDPSSDRRRLALNAPAHTRLSRHTVDARPAAPVRIVHLGLGNFFRAHQAWYTERSPDSDKWGIAAFTGRRPDQAHALGPQDGLYTLVTKAPHGDEFQILSSLSAVHQASDHDAFLGYLALPTVAVVTLTVTEAGYQRRSDGGLDANDPTVAADLAALSHSFDAGVRTVPGRLVAGLAARRAAASGALAIVPCDNLSSNGDVARRVVLDLASRLDADLAAWIKRHVSFVTTMVDRITPRTTEADRTAVLAATGLQDASPVVTEPFAEWVASGEFPAGRPRWDEAGVSFVDDVVPFETRKLFLLNGAHSLLAYAGSLRGHATVAAAIADPTCRAWVNQWWDEAQRQLHLPEADVMAYRGALLDRFSNPAIRHLLAQIAADGSQKLPVRIAPVLRAERAARRMPAGAVRVLGGWLLHLRGHGAPVSDAELGSLAAEVQGDLNDGARRVVHAVAPDLAGDVALADAVARVAQELVL
jgi:fructuronate reductase